MLTVIVKPDGQPARTVRIERFPCRIGRHRDCEVVLGSWRVARVHAEIQRLDRGFRLLDRGSLTGTWVNGERIVEYGPLAETDEVAIAGFVLHVIPGHADPVHERVGAAQAGGPRVPHLSGLRAVSGTAGISSRSSTLGAVPSAIPGCVLPSDLRSIPRFEPRPIPHAVPAGADARDHQVTAPSAIEQSTDALPRVEPDSGREAGDRPVRAHPDPMLEWRRILHRRLLQTIDLRRRDIRQLDVMQLRSEAASLLRELLSEDTQLPADLDANRLIEQVLDEAIGLGPLERLLGDASVTEIMVNGADEIYVERDGRLSRTDLVFSGEPAIRAVLDRIVAPLGRRIDESSPMVDARLDDGSRVNAIIPPLAVRGSAITIRRFNRQLFTPGDLVARGSASAAMIDLLRICVQHRRNVVISGGTGSGKTTLLNVLSNLIPESERIVTIEDAAELRLNHAHLVSLEARPPNAEGKGAVTIRELVRNALRMRPDRIVVGECRGGEALDMLQAMNTGHDGSLTTVHANSPRDVVARLETMVLMAGMDLPVAAIRDQIASAVHVIVHQARSADGRRRITEIAEVTGVEGSRVQMQPLMRFEQGRFRACGGVPQFFEALRANGVEIDLALLDGERA